MYHINRMKEKNYAIISFDRKSMWQYPTPFDDKTLNKLRIEGNFLNIKGISENSTANIILMKD